MEAWKTPLFALGKFGIYSKEKTKKVFVCAAFILILATYAEFMTVLQFLYVTDVYEMLYLLEGVCAYLQIIVKVYITAYNRDKLGKLFEETKYFWKTDVCSDKVKRNWMDWLIKMASYFPKIILVAIAVVLTLSSLYGIKVRDMPYGVWGMERYNAFHIFSITTITCITVIGGICLVAYDCIFFIFCVHLIIQFKILGHCLNKLSLDCISSEEDQRRYYEKLKLCIQHHNFLLRFVEDFRSYCAPAFFVEIATKASMICLEMYSLQENPNPSAQANSFAILTMLTIQLAYYCITVNYITDEALDVSSAVYSSNWYSNFSPVLRKPLTSIMQMSQREIKFTTLGFQINIRTVLTIYKAAWSFCTAMRRLKRSE